MSVLSDESTVRSGLFYQSILNSLVRSENILSSVSVPVDSIAYHLKRLETSVSLAAARLLIFFKNMQENFDRGVLCVVFTNIKLTRANSVVIRNPVLLKSV